MVIREADTDDVNAIVDIHMNAFNSFFLTSLGADFLRLYYSCFIKSDDTLTVVAEDCGKIVGFSAASKHSKGFNSTLIKKNFIKFGIMSCRLFFTTPKSLWRLVNNLSKTGDSVIDDENYAELYSIAVAVDVQRGGIGRQMLAFTEQSLRKNGVEKLSLTTDFLDNDSVVSFYHSMGYEDMYVFVAHPNRKMFRMIKAL